MCRKYDRYIIEVIRLNGNKQVKKADDTTSYKETMQLYRNIKDNMVGENAIINFVGISSDEDKIVLFSKKNTRVENARKNIRELMEVIDEASNELKERLKEVGGAYNILNKKYSNIGHTLIEAIEEEAIGNDKKVEVFDQIREITLERRDYQILDRIRRNVEKDVQFIIDKPSMILREYNSNIDKSTEILKDLIENEDSKYREAHTIKEFPYDTDKQAMSLMKQMKHKYDKIEKNSERKVLQCYKKCISA